LSREHQSDYDEETTARCERALVTLLGDIGPWSKRVYLAGGLAPRYIVGSLPEGARPHVGTTDVDLVIGLAVEDESDEAYRTLENNLKKAGFKAQNSFRWSKDVQGATVIVEFLCETDQVEAGRIFKPKQGTGSGLGAFNVRGAQLVTGDYIEREIEADRLDDGGRSRVSVRVANILAYTVLKILAFQDRHENKDSYDLVYCLLNFGDGPEDAGRAAKQSAIYADAQLRDALRLLADRFASVENDGPHAYAGFLAEDGDADEAARFRQEAVAVVRTFLAAANL
jgi:predicted nucleotidyltransferase